MGGGNSRWLGEHQEIDSWDHATLELDTMAVPSYIEVIRVHQKRCQESWKLVLSHGNVVMNKKVGAVQVFEQCFHKNLELCVDHFSRINQMIYRGTSIRKCSMIFIAIKQIITFSLDKTSCKPENQVFNNCLKSVTFC